MITFPFKEPMGVMCAMRRLGCPSLVEWSVAHRRALTSLSDVATDVTILPPNLISPQLPLFFPKPPNNNNSKGKRRRVLCTLPPSCLYTL